MIASGVDDESFGHASDRVGDVQLRPRFPVVEVVHGVLDRSDYVKLVGRQLEGWVPQTRNPHCLSERGLAREVARREGLVDHGDKPACADVGLFEPTARAQVDVRCIQVRAVDLMHVYGPGIRCVRTRDLNGHRPAPDPRPPSLSTAARRPDAPWRAGAKPNKSVVAKHRAKLNASTGRLSATSASSGMTLGGTTARIAFSPAQDPRTPSSEPARPSVRLSVSSCRKMRERPAPRADRMAISR